mmetsp:Transcript_11385/g.47643  ORF Transcript_11385/g.47643 Transcript_11385/m.47643 type:complete len:755 (-) Transcript_11385:195-2459(-)
MGVAQRPAGHALRFLVRLERLLVSLLAPVNDAHVIAQHGRVILEAVARRPAVRAQRRAIARQRSIVFPHYCGPNQSSSVQHPRHRGPVVESQAGPARPLRILASQVARPQRLGMRQRRQRPCPRRRIVAVVWFQIIPNSLERPLCGAPALRRLLHQRVDRVHRLAAGTVRRRLPQQAQLHQQVDLLGAARGDASFDGTGVQGTDVQGDTSERRRTKQHLARDALRCHVRGHVKHCTRTGVAVAHVFQGQIERVLHCGAPGALQIAHQVVDRLAPPAPAPCEQGATRLERDGQTREPLRPRELEGCLPLALIFSRVPAFEAQQQLRAVSVAERLQFDVPHVVEDRRVARHQHASRAPHVLGLGEEVRVQPIEAQRVAVGVSGVGDILVHQHPAREGGIAQLFHECIRQRLRRLVLELLVRPLECAAQQLAVASNQGLDRLCVHDPHQVPPLLGVRPCVNFGAPERRKGSRSRQRRLADAGGADDRRQLAAPAQRVLDARQVAVTAHQVCVFSQVVLDDGRHGNGASPLRHHLRHLLLHPLKLLQEAHHLRARRHAIALENENVVHREGPLAHHRLELVPQQPVYLGDPEQPLAHQGDHVFVPEVAEGHKRHHQRLACAPEILAVLVEALGELGGDRLALRGVHLDGVGQQVRVVFPVVRRLLCRDDGLHHRPVVLLFPGQLVALQLGQDLPHGLEGRLGAQGALSVLAHILEVQAHQVEQGASQAHEGRVRALRGLRGIGRRPPEGVLSHHSGHA